MYMMPISSSDIPVPAFLQWGMTCGSDLTIVHSTQSIYVAGIMTGSFIFGGLGDRFGRFPVLMACHMLCAFFAMCSSFANVWLLYTVIRYASHCCDFFDIRKLSKNARMNECRFSPLWFCSSV